MRQKVIFLDRDGVINRERGDYTSRLEDFVFVDDLVQSLRTFQSKGFKLIVVSNQSGIAKGLYSFADVEVLHKHLQDFMREQGIRFEEIYYCPHHPETGKCLCRKPGSLLIEKAIARFGVDAGASWFIGDRERDTEAAKHAGIRGILVESNSSLLKIARQLE